LRHLHVSIALMITKWTFGRVDWNLVENWASQGAKAAYRDRSANVLQQRIIREINAGTTCERAISNLFGFSKEIIRPAISTMRRSLVKAPVLRE